MKVIIFKTFVGGAITRMSTTAISRPIVSCVWEWMMGVNWSGVPMGACAETEYGRWSGEGELSMKRLIYEWFW